MRPSTPTRLQSTLIAFGALFLASLFPSPAAAQRSVSGETKLRLLLDEIGNLGSVMMIAAHPDDENTALLAYLARGRHVRTGYLSLTRGEGGQNLIGSEQSDELGIIRTQELLAARKIDGAEQYFTRAIDFGFTKTADETLGTKWPREKVLGDVVWAIRRFRPDVIILRFTGTPRDGHGQHQASAILGKEAFTAAADSKRFPEQLKYVKTWQAQRLMTNLPSFNEEQRKEIEKVTDKLELDLGAYSPELGYSYNEIAGMSRSQHRSQAMGTAERRGAVPSYLVTERGDKARKDIFENINMGWSRVPGGAEVAGLLQQATSAFVPAHPEAIVPLLTKARPKMAALARSGNDPLFTRKLEQLDEAIAQAGGVWVEAVSDKHSVTPGSEIKVTLTAIARNPAQVTLSGARLSGMTNAPTAAITAAQLVTNKPSQHPVTVKVPEGQPLSQPYWLRLPKEGAMYSVADLEEVGRPENAPVLTAEFALKVGGTDIVLKRPVEHRYVDRVYGELTRPLAIVPPVALEFGGSPVVFADGNPRRIQVPVKSNGGKVSGDVRLNLPKGWRSTPQAQHFELGGTNEETVVNFDLAPPPGESDGKVSAVATVNSRQVAVDTSVIEYPHFPAQTLFPAAESRLVRVEVKTLARRVGYVMGAGDEVPAALRQMGCEVTLLDREDLVQGNLSRFDAIVTGVRAWNTRADLRANHHRLFQYAEEGGTVIVQYNVPEANPQGRGAAGGGARTAPGSVPSGGALSASTGATPDITQLEHIGPYPLKESRDNKDRVTVEEAPVVFPNPKLPLLHSPNEITSKDFEGWIQERGVNFAVEWDPRYISVLESHDPGEKPMLGGMLYTRYGKGAYIFTAYSWFRELPAGVPGAYRVFANMLSAAKTQ